VAKWQGALEDVPDEPYPTLKPDLIDHGPDPPDPARFFVQVTDANKGGEGSITVSLSTESPGEGYDDDATELTLTEAEGEPGVFVSASLILVSNSADDIYRAYGTIDNELDDRTHKIALGGAVKVEYQQSEDVKFTAAAGTVYETVQAHVVILKDGDTILMGEAFLDMPAPDFNDGVRDKGEPWADIDENGAYTENLSEEDAEKRVDADFKVLNETCAQAGVRFAWTIEFKQAPAEISDGVIVLSPDAVSGDENLTADEKALLQAGFNSDSRTDIEVYYVPRSKREPAFTFGSAFPSDFYRNMTTPDLNDSVVVPDRAIYYSLSHEAVHIFFQSSRHEPEKWNLIYASPPSHFVREKDAHPTDSKRLTSDQETAIRESEYYPDP